MEVPDGVRKQCTLERRDGVLWTGTRPAIHLATRTTDFLPRHITTVARTARRTEQLLLTKVSDRDRNFNLNVVGSACRLTDILTYLYFTSGSLLCSTDVKPLYPSIVCICVKYHQRIVGLVVKAPKLAQIMLNIRDPYTSITSIDFIRAVD